MNLYDQIKRPSKEDQLIAKESSITLEEVLNTIKTNSTEIEIEETQDKIKIPINALKLLVQILKVTSQGKPISIVPIATEMTTQAAADLLGCSRPHIVKLLEEGKIAFTKIGKHRRVKFEDVMHFKKEMKHKQKENIIKIMHADEASGLYDTQHKI